MSDELPNYGLYEAAIVLEEIDGRRCATVGRAIVELLADDGGGGVLVRVVDGIGELEAGAVLTLPRGELVALDESGDGLRSV